MAHICPAEPGVTLAGYENLCSQARHDIALNLCVPRQPQPMVKQLPYEAQVTSAPLLYDDIPLRSIGKTTPSDLTVWEARLAPRLPWEVVVRVTKKAGIRSGFGKSVSQIWTSFFLFVPLEIIFQFFKWLR